MEKDLSGKKSMEKDHYAKISIKKNILTENKLHQKKYTPSIRHAKRDLM